MLLLLAYFIVGSIWLWNTLTVEYPESCDRPVTGWYFWMDMIFMPLVVFWFTLAILFIVVSEKLVDMVDKPAPERVADPTVS